MVEIVRKGQGTRGADQGTDGWAGLAGWMGWGWKSWKGWMGERFLAPGKAVEITEVAWEIGRSDRWRTDFAYSRVSLAS